MYSTGVEAYLRFRKVYLECRGNMYKAERELIHREGWSPSKVQRYADAMRGYESKLIGNNSDPYGGPPSYHTLINCDISMMTKGQQFRVMPKEVEEHRLEGKDEHVEEERSEHEGGAPGEDDEQPDEGKQSTPAEQPEGTPKLPKTGDPDTDALLELIEKLRTPPPPEIPKELIEQLVQQELNKQGKGKIEINMPNGEQVEFDSDGKHHCFGRAMQIVASTRNLWLAGPAGSGKTTLARQVADALGKDLAPYSCTQGMTESKLEGRLAIDGGFLSTMFIAACEGGHVILLDEFDAMNDNVRLIANNAIANRMFSVPNRLDNPVVEVHPETVFIIASNTWGVGANAKYTGRDTIDYATRDRFCMSKIYVGYDKELEQSIDGLGKWNAKNHANEPRQIKIKKTGERSHTLGHVLEVIRFVIHDNGYTDRGMSTRNKIDAVKLEKVGGMTMEEILEVYFADWGDYDEVNACLKTLDYAVDA